MGFLHRQRAPSATRPTGSKWSRNHTPYEPYSMGRRPTFGQWLKRTWLDIVTMIAMGAIGLGVNNLDTPQVLTSLTLSQVYEAKPAPSRSFAVTFSDGEIVWPEFAYPLRKEIIPI